MSDFKGHCEMLKMWQDAIIDRVQEYIRQQMIQLHESCAAVLQEAWESMDREEGLELVANSSPGCSSLPP